MAGAPQSFLVFGLVAVTAYLLGCSNGAVIISKYILHDDIRTHGSGNAGLTNFLRTFGGPWTLAVIAIDVLKAVLAILLAQWVMAPMGWVMIGKYWAAAFCLLGHMFPCMFGFKGGKGILSGGTIAIMLNWKLALLVWGGFLILTA
ncbi:MAG: glycerol-3-phosphate acyltransferase, partial [Oscillospiraceae bacterium]|nr:glycerol-3-phosphate acyltransferase [Oscillospiraceae bacterium]